MCSSSSLTGMSLPSSSKAHLPGYPLRLKKMCGLILDSSYLSNKVSTSKCQRVYVTFAFGSMHIQPHRSQLFLFFPSTPTPSIAWHLASSGHPSPSSEHPPPPVRVWVLGGQPHCLAGVGWVATHTLPASSPEPILVAGWGVLPTSWAEESDSLYYKTRINGAWASIHDLHFWCSEAATAWCQASVSRRRFMEKCAEWEIHSEKASTTCDLIACTVS